MAASQPELAGFHPPHLTPKSLLINNMIETQLKNYIWWHTLGNGIERNFLLDLKAKLIKLPCRKFFVYPISARSAETFSDKIQSSIFNVKRRNEMQDFLFLINSVYFMLVYKKLKVGFFFNLRM